MDYMIGPGCQGGYSIGAMYYYNSYSFRIKGFLSSTVGAMMQSLYRILGALLAPDLKGGLLPREPNLA